MPSWPFEHHVSVCVCVKDTMTKWGIQELRGRTQWRSDPRSQFKIWGKIMLAKDWNWWQFGRFPPPTNCRLSNFLLRHCHCQNISSLYMISWKLKEGVIVLWPTNLIGPIISKTPDEWQTVSTCTQARYQVPVRLWQLTKWTLRRPKLENYERNWSG